MIWGFKTKAKRVLFSAILFFMLVASCFAAEDPAKFPSKPITMIVIWAPGGTADLTGRKLADLAGKILGQPIVVENKVGGGGVIGTNALAKAAPDGYTLAVMTYSPLVIIPHLRSVPYDTKKDFTFIMSYFDNPMIFGVLAESPWKTLKEFVEEARKNPGKMKYSTAGLLNGQHIFMEYVFSMEKVKATFIPMSGGVEATRQVLGGHVEGALAPDFIPYVLGGKTRGLATQNEERIPAVPNIPTFYELGYKIESPLWTGICGPTGLHPLVLRKLFDAFHKAYEDPSFKEFMNKIYMPMVFKDSEAFTKTVFKEFDTQGRLLKELGLVK